LLLIKRKNIATLVKLSVGASAETAQPNLAGFPQAAKNLQRKFAIPTSLAELFTI
jgi:hypothetical protein